MTRVGWFGEGGVTILLGWRSVEDVLDSCNVGITVSSAFDMTTSWPSDTRPSDEGCGSDALDEGGEALTCSGGAIDSAGDIEVDTTP